MKLYYHFLIIFIVLLRNSQVVFNLHIKTNIIKSYFEWKNIGALNIYTCPEDEDTMAKTFFIHGENNNALVSIKNINVENEILETSLVAQHYRIGVYINFDCPLGEETFKKVSQNERLNSSYSFLLWMGNIHVDKVYFQSINLSFDCDVVFTSSSMIFYDVYKINTDTSTVLNRIGSWDDTGNIEMSMLKVRNNLNGTLVRGMIVLTSLQVNEDTIEEQVMDNTLYPQLDVLTRFSFSVHKHLEATFNYITDLKVTNEWGYYQEELGHWDAGLFRSIELGETDLGITLCRIFPSRLDVSFFLPPIKKFRTCFIFKHPSTLADYTAFAMPFSAISWFCVLSMILVSGLVLRLVRHFEIKDNPPNEPSFVASLLLIIGTMSQQGLYVDSLRIPTRVLAIFLEFTSLLIYSYYGAEIVGFLLTPSPKTINTLDKLIESPIKMTAEDLPYNKNHFLARINPLIIKAYEKGLQGKSDSFLNLTYGLKHVQKGTSALYAQDSNLYTVIDKTFSNVEKCALTEIEILVLWSSTVVRKNSPYKELMYRGIMKIRESGLLEREDKRWHSQRPHCIKEQESVGVKFEATLIAQAIFASGILLSIIIFYFEYKVTKIKIVKQN